nr:lacticin 481/lactococcin biosynthesis protein LcnDR2-like [Nerophis lumbriciformis]
MGGSIRAVSDNWSSKRPCAEEIYCEEQRYGRRYEDHRREPPVSTAFGALMSRARLVRFATGRRALVRSAIRMTIRSATVTRAFGAIPLRHADAGREGVTQLAAFARIFEHVMAKKAERRALDLPEGEQPDDFLMLLRPEINLARLQLEMKGQYPEAPFETEEVVGLLMPSLLNSVRFSIVRTMTMKLHAAEAEGRLVGETARERRRHFLDGLRANYAAQKTLAAKPILSSLVMRQIQNWRERSLEFLMRLTEDRRTLQERFAPRGLGRLTEVNTGYSDPHSGGRSVVVVRFDSGVRVVYKPRSLRVEEACHSLLAWTCKKGFEPAFRPLSILSRMNYGWMEFIEARSCENEEQVQCFYRRLGGQLALLYLLEASDLHYENLIAHGEHPILVDLESICHPSLGELDAAGSWSLPARETVLGVGLLPQKLSSDPGTGSDFGALREMAGAEVETTLLQPPKGRDEQARFERCRVALEGGAKRSPAARGSSPSCGGPLAGFAEVETRVIFRPTSVYGRVLVASVQPQFLTDSAAREALFGKLGEVAQRYPWLEKLAVAERRDLERGDIPRFTTTPNSRNLWDAIGEETPSYFLESGLEAVGRRLASLGGADLERQRWVLGQSIELLKPPAAHDTRHPCKAPQLTAESPSPVDFLEAACEVADRLRALVFEGPWGAHWITLQASNPSKRFLGPTGLALFDGLPGIALFLAHLESHGGRPEDRHLKQEVMKSILGLIDRHGDAFKILGGYTGWGGLLYLFSRLEKLEGEDRWRRRSAQATQRIAALVNSEPPEALGTDIISGAAAVALGDLILAGAVETPVGKGWLSEVGLPLAGFSHGAAGITWALSRLHSATGEPRFLLAAQTGLEYERSLFDPRRGNWRDLRSPESFMVAWCHGAPGIGLSRLLPSDLSDPKTHEELEVAVQTTLAAGFGGNHCLCHGDLGNLDFLLETALHSGDAALKRRAYRIAGGLLKSRRETDYRCGLGLGFEPAGLMVGLAGIGYEWLRLAAPLEVPSCLLLSQNAAPVPHFNRGEHLRSNYVFGTEASRPA